MHGIDPFVCGVLGGCKLVKVFVVRVTGLHGLTIITGR